MKRCLLCLLAVLLLTGCVVKPYQPTDGRTETTDAPTETTATPTETTVAPAETTLPLHSRFYIPGVEVEEVIDAFNEVVLAAEFVNGGDPSVLQKWEQPIVYGLNGAPTQEDLAVLGGFCGWLNSIEGFPGIRQSVGLEEVNLRIHFCEEPELRLIMGENFFGVDGAVTFWYDYNVIYDAVICYRSDIDQYTRNSVILEEIYNGLGPVQDSDLRTDSIIYSGYSVPQSLTPMDELILRLLYHPDMRCGMNARECEAVIRTLYY